MQASVKELKFKAFKGGHNDGLTISSAVVLNPSETYNPGHYDKVLIQALTQNIRYTLDGTTPTATKGYQLKAGDPPIIIGGLAGSNANSGNILTVIEETATADMQFNFGD